MPGILQEKFQVHYPREKRERENWTSAASARTKKGMDGTGVSGADGSELPPGMNIANQVVTDQPRMGLVMSGESDVSRDNNAEARRRGFKRLAMRATDDEYSNAHVDAFYGEIDVDGDVGFTERNNMLDRL